MSEVSSFVSLETFSAEFPTVTAAVELNLYPFEHMCYTHRATHSRCLWYKQVEVWLDNLLHQFTNIKKVEKRMLMLVKVSVSSTAT